MGLALAATSLGFLVGPPLAGIMASHWGTASPFILAGIIAIIDGILRILLVKDAELPDDDTGGPLTVLRVPGSWSIVLLVIYGAAIPAAIQPILPQHLHSDEFTVGLLYSVSAVAVLFANPLAGMLTASVRAGVLGLIGILVGACSLITLAYATTPIVAGFAMACMGVSGAFTLTPANTLISEQGQRSIPPTLGGTFALSNLAYGAGMTIGPLLTGIGAAETGYVMTLLVTTVVLTIIGVAALPTLPSLPLPAPGNDSSEG